MNVLPVLLTVGIFGLVVYRRFKRSFGRQPVSKKRLGLRAVLIMVVVAFIVASSVTSPVNLLEDLVGVGIGGVTAAIGLTFTEFEHTDDGAFYEPHPYVGVAVFALFLLRLASHLYPLVMGNAANSTTTSTSASGMPTDPLTVVVLLVFLGYYACYSTGVLVVSRRTTSTASE
ncbi:MULTISPECIES: CcdC protein domain-containing protein [unclassified Haladaptatus]|uniref:CcdC protein domain-containing protein n=1 Tax=unclassified Haladaptatus TaxID=2622732 RepID=UPI00209BF6B5|nr:MULTISPECIES: CcdC protein domain-containing protein [unclassified Haladaptatus]MCO8246899.1 cytochrome c biogenesis protein CcdC [Haladaptatus sp. AB643]MCO8253575.1 cytochrome c biogenesis protein CcdC [Haladaptatus sp. AB618]